LNPNTTEILEKILRRIVPSTVEKERVYSLSKKIMERVSSAAREAALNAEVSLEGSVAKDTWLSGEADIDIFLKVESSLDRKELETTCLEVAKEATKEYTPIERFADHPYVETFIGNARVNIVPCYRVEKGMWKSATDRTPYHTEYMNRHLSPELRNETRLLKKFTKGTGTYGAEIRVGGFSGMLCETLILFYGSLKKTLGGAASWRSGTVIDIENHYGGDLEEIHNLFDQPLIVIDPVDKVRNLAAAVRDERLWEFVSASRLFPLKPAHGFFYPPKQKTITPRSFTKVASQRGTCVIGLQFGRFTAPVDVVWSQMYKTERSLINLMRSKGFSVVSSSSYGDENDFNIIMIELESRILPRTTKHLGPPVERIAESNKFLSTHLRAENTVAGPWIEKDRWVAHKRRRYTDAKQLLEDSLTKGGRDIGVSSLIAECIRKNNYRILTDRQLTKFLNIEGFSKFMIDHLVGKPHWLTQP